MSVCVMQNPTNLGVSIADIRWDFGMGNRNHGGPASHLIEPRGHLAVESGRPPTPSAAKRPAGSGSLVGPPFRRPPLSQPDQQINKFVLRRKPRRHAAVEGCRPQTHLQIARKRPAGAVRVIRAPPGGLTLLQPRSVWPDQPAVRSRSCQAPAPTRHR
jgi:hypothetical protein